MSLDAQTVRKVATLARLDVPEDRLAPMAAELSKILAFVEQLNQVDTTGVAPLMSVSQVTLPQREDVQNDGGYPEKILANAPEQQQGFFVVPKVVV